MRDRFETARLPVAPFKFQIKINVGFNRGTENLGQEEGLHAAFQIMKIDPPLRPPNLR
jgi:hypothetical protein